MNSVRIFPLLALMMALTTPSRAADYDSYKDWKAPVPVYAPAPSRAVYVVVVDWLDNEEFEMRVDRAVIERFNLKAGDRISPAQAFKLREAEDELEAMRLR